MTMENEKKNKPVEKFRLGSSSVALWKNESQNNGAFYTLTPSRTYATKEGELRNSDSFNITDALNLVNCILRTVEYYQKEIQPQDEAA
jgi:bisphosphoglycerate-dependent phosphoglycerate mutase